MSESQNQPKLLLRKPKKGLHPPGGEMADSATRVPVQQPAVAVPAVSAKLASYYRYRAGVGALLLVNLGIGGYVFYHSRPFLDDQTHHITDKPVSAVPGAPVASSVADNAAHPWTPPPKVPVSEDEQRQVLQWMLEEMRKVNTQNKAEKARIDEDKKLLKQLLRERHLPSLP
ncbi:uncharacterized protein [Physcomitrium patens]|uniref:Uncharacterized protein n=1 Tax=Physcomitrium patens TaxID=3218 RepID=A0A2K1JH75_PHYPA|nr:uncharacterized protein LOC112291712 [Physcomitrium patens]PNR40869.1 hypothetical protein PHYPA_018272 [Physcomitrium patens]|eukprot:XP_024395294.1 uncharacterized protein LOC112291712 [Physcomitrella patens]